MSLQDDNNIKFTVDSVRASIDKLEAAVFSAKQAFSNRPNLSNSVLERFNAWSSLIKTQRERLENIEKVFTETNGTGYILRDINIINSISEMITVDAADLLGEMTNTHIPYPEKEIN